MAYESMGVKNKIPPVKEYLDEIKLYVKNIINDLKKSDRWKI